MTSTDDLAASSEHTKALAKKKRFLWRMVIVLVGGMFLDGYILGIIGPITGTIEHSVDGMTPFWVGAEAASALIGIMVAAPIGGILSDKFGRRPLLYFDLALFVIASAAQFFVDGPTELFVVRLLMGIAIGVEYAVGWPMLAEFAPVDLRGKLLGGNLIAFYAGFMVAYFVGYFMNQAGISWQVILGSSTPIALVLLIGRIGLPESPRWLWAKGEREQAMSIADEYMDTTYSTDMALAVSGGPAGSFKMLFSPAVWRSTVFLSVFWACAVTPYFAIATFADKIMKDVGLTGLLGGVILSVAAFVGVICWTIILDRFKRRTLTVPPQWIAAALLLVIALWAGAPAWIMLIMFLGYSFLNAAYTEMTAIYPPEIFPTELRGIGTGFAAASSRIGSAIGLFLIPLSLDHLGFAWTMLIAAGIGIVGALVCQVLAPETSGKSLSELANDVSH